jgi:DNA invertase Pin-like site-specific DNA recombinase
MSKTKVKAVAYLRTSSTSNVGVDKDSEKRQKIAITKFARSAGYEIADADWFYDPGVSGADSIESRAGFQALLNRIDGNGVRVVLIDEPSRFARDLTTQELGISLMIGRDVKVFAANGDELTVTDDPMRIAMRQIAGAFMQLEKTRLVDKLRSARERKRATGVQVEGRRPLHVTHPDAVLMAKKLHRANPRTGEHMSLRKIAAKLADAGHVNMKGAPYAANVVARMIEGPMPSVSSGEKQ